LAAKSVYALKDPDSDEKVRWQLGIDNQLGEEALELRFGETPPPPPPRPEPAESGRGDMILLPISDVRFAHNDQGEHFVHCTKDCSVLQLAVELVVGITPLEAVPTFTVCWHAGHWYCRSGNRRLAAIALASLFAPHRFHAVWVRAVATDPIFLRGPSSTGRPKFTTNLNGIDCEGRWMLIKETGEAVGHPSVFDVPPYGADLLALLPQPDVVGECSSTHTGVSGGTSDEEDENF
jgi:hypothetical protein